MQSPSKSKMSSFVIIESGEKNHLRQSPDEISFEEFETLPKASKRKRQRGPSRKQVHENWERKKAREEQGRDYADSFFFWHEDCRKEGR